MEGLKQIPDESVQCVVTSPPYWGLRDYGIEGQVWGGEEGCGHEWGDEIPQDSRHCYNKNNSGKKHIAADEYPKGRDSICRLCGAWKGSYGLEPTPELYIEHTVEIFREVRRVLRKDGIFWLNLGDCYSGSGKAGSNPEYQKQHTQFGAKERKERLGCPTGVPKGLKPKDLCGIPWRVALALQADGWWLRSDIIWSKPNPMPESCTDRPTKSHEYIFLMTKSAKYFYDQEAVREPLITPIHKPGNNFHPDQITGPNDRGGHSQWEDTKIREWGNPNGRNLRTVWEIATAPFPQAHFATFPPAIPERCIKAGTSEKGCCPKCGAGWVRQIQRKFYGDFRKGHRDNDSLEGSRHKLRFDKEIVPPQTLGWQSSCSCGLDPIPCAVLDPFSGAGTTALVAAKLGRDAIGIELNPEYVEMSRKRIAQELGFLAEMEVVCPGNP